MSDISTEIYAGKINMDSMLQTLRDAGVDTTEMQASLDSASNKTSKSAFVETANLLQEITKDILTTQEKATLFIKKYEKYVIESKFAIEPDDDLLKKKIKEKVSLVFKDATA
jgi:hypothetical protein